MFPIPATIVNLDLASDIVVAGDSVICLAGEYVGFYHTTNGTFSQPIVFLGQGLVEITSPNGITDDGINIEGADYITIDNFRVSNMPRTGIRAVENVGVILKNNYCSGNQKWGILTGFSETVKILNNICEYSVEEHGIYHGNSADYPTISNNTCRYNHAAGIHMNADASLGGDGIISHAVVTNNIIHDNGVGGGSGINCDGVQNSFIANNLIYNNHASGISLYMIDAAEPCNGTSVVNNTIHQPADGRWGLNVTNGSQNVTAFNNIIVSEHAFRGSISIDPIALSTFQSDYSIYSDRMSIDDGETVISLANWNITTNLDMMSSIHAAAELFNNVLIEDYWPSFFGPCVDAGIMIFSDVFAPMYDIGNLPRPAFNGYDIGCYEFWYDGIDENQIKTQINWMDIKMNDLVNLFEMNGEIIATRTKQELLNQHYSDGLYIFTCQSLQGKISTGRVSVIGGRFH
jgi:parallel beta-helix repeat protein